MGQCLDALLHRRKRELHGCSHGRLRHHASPHVLEPSRPRRSSARACPAHREQLRPRTTRRRRRRQSESSSLRQLLRLFPGSRSRSNRRRQSRPRHCRTLGRARIYASALTSRRVRPIVAHLFISKGKPFARPRLSSRRKPDHHSPRVARRPHHFHDHGLRGRRQPAHPLRGGYARRRRSLCHLHFFRGRHAHHGTVGQLSHRPRSWHVPQRLLHLLHRPRPRLPLANGPRRRLSLRAPVSPPHAHQSARTNRQRHPRLPQIRHRRRHRPVHRLHRPA